MAKRTKTLQFLLNLSKCVGLDSTHQSIFTKCLQTITCLCGAFLLMTNVLEVALNWNGITTISRVDYFPILLVVFAKHICSIVNNKNLYEMIKQLENLWDMDKFGKSFGAILDSYHDLVTKAVKIFGISCIFTMGVLLAVPLITKKNALIFPGYAFCDIKTTPCFEIQLAAHILHCSLIMMPLVVPFDCLFLAFVAYAYCAIENVNYALNRVSVLNEDESNEKLVEQNVAKIVDQHNHILTFIKQLNNYYSGMLLVQFWATLFTLISSLYMITYEGFPIKMDNFFRNASMMTVIAFQLFMYCIAGTLLTEKTLTIADAAFAVNWSIRTQARLRKYLSMIIQRSNKIEKVTIGKMGVLNLVAFVSLLRQSVSIYTLLLNLESGDKDTKL